MGVIIDSISFSNEFKPADTSWLLANIGEKITVTIDNNFPRNNSPMK